MNCSFLKLTQILPVVMLISLVGCGLGLGNNYANSPYNHGNQQYRQPQPYQQQPVPQPQNGYYSNQPTGQTTSQPAGYYGGYPSTQPGSRYYRNPYAFPPQGQYPYRDSDQYYVPVRGFGGGGSDNDAPPPAQFPSFST